MSDPYRQPQQYDVTRPDGQPLAPPAPAPAPAPAYPPPPPYLPAGLAPPGPPPKRKRRPVLVVLGVAGAITVALCGAVAIAAGIHSGSQPAAGPAATTDTASSGPAAAVITWWSGGGSALVDKLGADFADLHASSSTKTGQAQVTAVRAGCAKIQADTKAAQAYKPVPDQQAQASWAKALGLYAQGATDCLTGIDRLDTALITHSADEIHQGTDALNAVSDRIAQLGG
jgi:hypothetical protein